MVACDLNDFDEPTALDFKEELMNSAVEDFGEFEGVKTTVNYEIADEYLDQYKIGDSSHEYYRVNVVTYEDVNKNQILEVLKDVLNNLDREKYDNIGIFLNNRNYFKESSHFLGSLLYSGGQVNYFKTSEKDWTMEPDYLDYEVYEIVKGKIAQGYNKSDAMRETSSQMEKTLLEIDTRYRKIIAWINMDLKE